MFDTSYLLISLVISSIGFGYFLYGKKQKHRVAYFSGIGLMVFPYAITDPTTMILIGVTLMATPKLAKMFGIGE